MNNAAKVDADARFGGLSFGHQHQAGSLAVPLRYQRAASRDHLARLGGGNQAALEAGSLFLMALRDIKQVNSHLASIGCAIMEPEEHVLATNAERSKDRHKLLQG